MSDYDESFDDSFDSASESDHGVAGEDEYLQNQNETNIKASTNFQSMFSGGGGLGLDVPSSMKELQLLSGNNARVHFESMSVHDDWRTKDERSPKPKKKFGSNFSSTLRKSAIGSIRKPNMANFKQKIKNKLRKDLAIFGLPLETAIQKSLLGRDGIELPTVFRECISFLEEHWLDHEGLYRLPGVKSKIEEAKSRYDRGEVVDLDDYDPNVAASLLKLYLRELPDPLVSPRVTAMLEAATVLPMEEQCTVLEEQLENVPAPNKLILSWLLEHIKHIIQHSAINKMSLPNLVIVFSPTLQLSAPILHALYNNNQRLFGEIELVKYEKPVVEKKVRRLKLPNLKDLDELTTEQEITAELDKLTALLDKLHNKMSGKYDEKDEYIWELQRTITDLRRKKKAFQKKKADTVVTQAGGEDEFMKTLLLMEATLTAENEELLAQKDMLQAAIRRETELIEQYRVQLQDQELSRLVESCDDSGDEGELARKVATLKWHGKELELRNRNLVQSIKEEGDEIIQLKVKLKVLPLKQKLNVDE